MAPKAWSARCSRAASMSASPTPARPRCTSSPRSTRCRACAACWACSRASSPAPPTATTGCSTSRPPRSLHLGPGLANGLANLHNAKKASSGIVNIVGEHATYHITFDAPLTSDIEGVARPMSHWVKTSPDSRQHRCRWCARDRGGPRHRPDRDAYPSGRYRLGSGQRRSRDRPRRSRVRRCPQTR